MIILYVKQHKITKLLYFGKTTRNIDPDKYNGSGKYWRSHLQKHGEFVDTLCIWEFINQEQCSEFALNFSIENDITNSPKWANLKNENGLDGGGRPKGYKHSSVSIEKMKKPKSDSHRLHLKLSCDNKAEKNPSFGTIGVTNDIVNKRIKPNEILHYVQNGYRLGFVKKINITLTNEEFFQKLNEFKGNKSKMARYLNVSDTLVRNRIKLFSQG